MAMHENPIRILLVEDEYITLETLTTVLTQMNYHISGDAMSAAEAIKVLEKDETDLAILDISIRGDKDGVWLAQQINEKYNIPFIFLTAHGDPATLERAIETEPYGYLVKPFNKATVSTSIEVALKNFAKQHNPTLPHEENETDNNFSHVVIKDRIFIRDHYMFIKLRIDDILFVKSDKNYLEVHLLQKRHLVRGSLGDFSEYLPKEKFMRVHRSYVVNMEAIESFGAGFLNINNQEIPLGTAYKEELRKRFTMF